MYGRAGILSGGTAMTLPFTGFNLFWIALAAFTLAAAGVALLRLVPKRVVHPHQR